ncbi:MAG: DUF4430 domain-containing protein [Candidatus Aenigmarchaeota archaeon]|nr:DUF4430 domain-containing protein [Candidatus Aenigmarchaeota archaeon]
MTPRDSAFDALKRVAVVDYRIFSNGIYITAINGIKQKDGHYWFYFVNGKAPNIGCDYYHPRDGDSIVFRYVSGKEASKYL